MTRTPVPAAADRGSSSVELAVLTPVVLLIVLLAVAAGRVSTAHQAVDHAATVAARDATLARTPAVAHSAATATANRLLAERDLTCTHIRLTVATGDFTGGPSMPGRVRVDVACELPLADLALPGLPGNATVTSSFTSVTDPYRGRT